MAMLIRKKAITPKNAITPKKRLSPLPMSPKQQSLGGSVFIHNAIEFDYCIKESLMSLCAVCDEVVVLDAQSTDGTQDYLREIKKGLPKLKIIEGATWECADNFNRLPMLANLAKRHLSTDWHFMLQADEVIHENSFPYIRQAMSVTVQGAVFVRRLNFFGDYNHYIRIDQPMDYKPCSDQIVRLATLDHEACGDAESLQSDPHRTNPDFLNDIVIFHYGMVRDDAKFIKKVLSMQSWFWGPGCQPDSRVVEIDKRGTEVFDWTMFKTRDMLTRHNGSHPRFAHSYVEERQARKPMKL